MVNKILKLSLISSLLMTSAHVMANPMDNEELETGHTAKSLSTKDNNNDNSDMNWEDLPGDLLGLIATGSGLPLEDILNASTVCTKWRDGLFNFLVKLASDRLNKYGLLFDETDQIGRDTFNQPILKKEAKSLKWPEDAAALSEIGTVGWFNKVTRIIHDRENCYNFLTLDGVDSLDMKMRHENQYYGIAQLQQHVLSYFKPEDREFSREEIIMIAGFMKSYFVAIQGSLRYKVAARNDCSQGDTFELELPQGSPEERIHKLCNALNSYKIYYLIAKKFNESNTNSRD